MAQDGDTRCSDEPKNGGERRGQEAERNADDHEGCVELRCGGTPAANLEVVALELSDSVHATNEQEDDEKQAFISEQAVDDEHGEDGSIVAREVAQVVVDPALNLAEVGRLGDAFDVEELVDGAKVCEAARQRL